MKSRRGLILGAVLMAGGAGNLASTPLSRMNLPNWRARFNAKQIELHQNQVDLLWLGDSITQQWEYAGPQPWQNFQPIWQHYYGDRHAINLGFIGDATSHLLWRIENGETDHIHPRAAIVLIGANNFGKLHWPAGPTLDGIEAITSTLHQRLPQTKILLISVLPSIRSPWVDANTGIVNKSLALRYAHDPVVTFVDVSALFVINGKVDASFFIDSNLKPPNPPLHPTAQTQARIAAAIEPTLAHMLGDTPH